MPKINSKSKGKAGELELAALLKDELRLEVRRNLEQTAVGGFDLNVEWPSDYRGWAIECKRSKTPRVREWWQQTATQAARSRVNSQPLKPVLIYRLDRQPWLAMMSLFDLCPHLQDHSQVTMKLESWCNLVRQEMKTCYPRNL